MRHITCLVALLCSWSIAHSHHSPAAFDMTREIRLDGRVVSFQWKNPHTFITLDVTGADGSPVRQEIEASPAAILGPMGVGPDALKPGDHVIVHARPSRIGPGRTALGVTFEKDDGTTLPLHLTGREAAVVPAVATATSLAGQWLGRPEDFFGLRTAVMQQWPLTPAARNALGANADERAGTRARCVPYGPPALMVEPVLTTIEVGADRVTLTTDIDGAALQRVVYLGVANHPANLPPTPLGHSIGRWEGNVLVIDTAGFTRHDEGFGFGVPSSERKHLVERLTLASDGSRLRYETIIEDDETLTAPVRFDAELLYRPDLTPSGTACDLDAAQRYLLGGE